jgi:hypothetical protein
MLARFLFWKQTVAQTEANDQVMKPAWFDKYESLRAEGWTWRKAAYIAWAASPTTDRWPESEKELATLILGMKSDKTIRKWRKKDKGIIKRILAILIGRRARKQNVL